MRPAGRSGRDMRWFKRYLPRQAKVTSANCGAQATGARSVDAWTISDRQASTTEREAPDSSAAWKISCAVSASCGVTHPRRSPSAPSRSARKAAHICRIASEKPNSKIAPVVVANADWLPISMLLPQLAAVADGEALDHLRAGGGELDAAVHAERADPPRVHLARGDPLGREREREAGVGVDRGVVPRVAADGLAVGAGALAGRCPGAWRGALCGRQPSRSGRCRTCMPRSFMTPASPQNSAWRFQLIGLARSRSLECRNACSTSISSPSAPVRIVS